MQLTVKSLKVAEAIAKALNHLSPGVGDRYLDGYMRRKMIETDAKRALRRSYSV